MRATTVPSPKPRPAPPRTDAGASHVATAHQESDEALMHRFCAGDGQAFDALFARHAGPVRGYLARLTASPTAADDLTQATFLSLVRARGRFARDARFKPWLYAIATNAARDWHRRHSRPEDLTGDGELPRGVAADDDGPARDPGLERAVQAALAQLPESLRLPILLHRFEGMSFAEVAEAMGLSETAVKVRAHRGYERLRGTLSKLWKEMQG